MLNMILFYGTMLKILEKGFIVLFSRAPIRESLLRSLIYQGLNKWSTFSRRHLLMKII